LTVSKRVTSTSVTCSPTTITVGSATTCTATSTDTSAGTPTVLTGTVLFSSSSSASTFTTSTCTLSGSGASATCQVIYTSAGSAPRGDLVLAAYTGDASHAISSNTFQVQIMSQQIRSTTTTVLCTPSTVFLGQPTQCIAAVADPSSTPSSPTGTVTFTPGGSCTLSGTGPSATCSISITPSSTGTLTVVASYAGDSSSTPHSASSGSTSVTVNPASTNLRATTMTVVCTPSTILVFQAASCTATVTDTASGTPSPPTGTITFTTGGTCSLTGTGSSTSCSVTLSPTTIGTLTVAADYPGDSGHNPSSGELDAMVTKRPTAMTVSCSPSTITVGQASICIVTAVDSAGTTTTIIKPTGSVTFTPGGASCTLANTGTATTCSADLTPTGYGTIAVTADYTGDTYHTGISGTASLTVRQPVVSTTTTTLACNPSTLQTNHSANCTATVVDTSTNPTHPSGTVSFASNGPGSFGSSTSCTLQPGSGIGASSCSVTYVPSSVGGGAQTLTASYRGDSTHSQTQGTTSLMVQNSSTPSNSSNPPGNSGWQHTLLDSLLLPAIIGVIAVVAGVAVILVRLHSARKMQRRP
jgi:Bacterial Ig-like domain (group 3)